MPEPPYLALLMLLCYVIYDSICHKHSLQYLIEAPLFHLLTALRCIPDMK